MASEAKLAANRQNALKSTGPKTPQGKVRSSANALTHGLTATHFVATGESVADFEKLAQDMLAQFPPRNEIEKHQVHRLIELLWKLRRARLLETAALSISNHNDNNPILQFPFTDNTKLPLPERYKLELRVSDLRVSDIFEFAEKVDGYTGRMWREIQRLADDLASNRMLEPDIVMIEAQAEEI